MAGTGSFMLTICVGSEDLPWCLNRLRDVEGGDEPRFALLAGILGARLVGRSGLPREALGLMYAVLQARGIPLPEQARCTTTRPCIRPCQDNQDACASSAPMQEVLPMRRLEGHGSWASPCPC